MKDSLLSTKIINFSSICGQTKDELRANNNSINFTKK